MTIAIFILVFLLLIAAAVLVFYYSWRRRTYCPDGTKHDWHYEDGHCWYWRPDGSFIDVVEHTVARYNYTCRKFGRKMTREKAYFCRGPYRPTREDWELE